MLVLSVLCSHVLATFTAGLKTIICLCKPPNKCRRPISAAISKGKTLHEQNHPILNWRCIRLAQVDTYNGRETIVVVVVVVVSVAGERTAKWTDEDYGRGSVDNGRMPSHRPVSSVRGRHGGVLHGTAQRQRCSAAADSRPDGVSRRRVRRHRPRSTLHPHLRQPRLQAHHSRQAQP